MKERVIQTSIHYPPIHHFEAYRSNGQPTISLPATEVIAARELTLPLYPAMSSDDIELVVRSVQSSLQEEQTSYLNYCVRLYHYQEILCGT